MNSFFTSTLFPSTSPEPTGLQSDIALDQFNSFGLVAHAQAYLAIHSMAELNLLRNLPSEIRQLPMHVLGGGSNVVLRGDVAGLVLHMRARGMAKVGEDAQHIYVRAAAGESWHGLVEWTLQQGWGGLENLSLIPGTVGAAPIQNIGAYGLEVRERFVSAHVFDRDTGEIVQLSKQDCAFGYRDSIFKSKWHERGIILDVLFALPKAWQPQLGYAELANYCAAQDWQAPNAQQISQAVIAIRQRKLPDPKVLGNAGSFFKNPLVPAAQRDALLLQYPQLVSYAQPDGQYKLAAGWLIEQTGWKGKSLGKAGVYAQQALVLVNHGGARGADILALAAQIQEDVAAKFAVQLEPEPVLM